MPERTDRWAASPHHAGRPSCSRLGTTRPQDFYFASASATSFGDSDLKFTAFAPAPPRR